MSMWEIEGLIEDSIHLVDQVEVSPAEKRQLIWNLYEIQRQYDTSFTNFRVVDILLKYDYMQTYSIQDYPDYAKNPAYFDEIKEKKSEWINKRPGEKYGNDNYAIAYWQQRMNAIYVDFGSKHYTLHDEQPIKENPFAIGLTIVEFAHQAQNRYLVHDWIGFLLSYVLGWNTIDGELDPLAEYFSKLKPIYDSYDFSNYEPSHPAFQIIDVNQSEYFSEFSEQQQELYNFMSK